MKKTLLIVFILSSFFSFGQTAKEMLAEIEGKWKLDNSGNVTFTKVIEVPNVSKDDLFTRGLSYFTYKYNSGEDVVQVKDKEQGLIIGKGIYPKVHTGVSLITTEVDATHILRIDIKDSKVRAIVTLQQYFVTLHGGSSGPSRNTYNISSRYPIAQKDSQKTVMTKAFYKSYKKAMETLDELEKALKEGNTGQENSDNW